MIDYEYYYEQYRRQPTNSTTTQKDLIEYHSTVSTSTNNTWSKITKQPITTTYIDGSKLLNFHGNSYNVNGLFPKGKYRRKPTIPYEKKINPSTVSISLIPTKKIGLPPPIIQSEKTQSSSLSMTSTLPDVQQKKTYNRICSSIVLDNKNSEAKFYGHRATTCTNDGWIRRYKSIKQSQIITKLLSNPTFREQMLHKTQTDQQLSSFSSSSTLSLASSLSKRRREKR
ncbi:unnamed protein product [Adineta steineri]|uniref:Uncharacterized protein n=1 Tax=Adineta steineri TaxID=433720 RepID=A0A813NAB9_9BILA|nr:unnamed protein product [Adineta steineri]